MVRTVRLAPYWNALVPILWPSHWITTDRPLPFGKFGKCGTSPASNIAPPYVFVPLDHYVTVVWSDILIYLPNSRNTTIGLLGSSNIVDSTHLQCNIIGSCIVCSIVGIWGCLCSCFFLSWTCLQPTYRAPGWWLAAKLTWGSNHPGLRRCSRETFVNPRAVNRRFRWVGGGPDPVTSLGASDNRVTTTFVYKSTLYNYQCVLQSMPASSMIGNGIWISFCLNVFLSFLLSHERPNLRGSGKSTYSNWEEWETNVSSGLFVPEQ